MEHIEEFYQCIQHIENTICKYAETNKVYLDSIGGDRIEDIARRNVYKGEYEAYMHCARILHALAQDLKDLLDEHNDNDLIFS